MVNRVAALAVIVLLIGSLFVLFQTQAAGPSEIASSCSAGQYGTGEGGTGTWTCSQVTYSGLAGLPFNASKGLVGYWSLNEAQGTSAYDYSGKSNTGTLTNTPTWTAGKFGSALSFASTSGQYVITASATGISGSSARSFFAWVYITSNCAGCGIAGWGAASANLASDLYLGGSNNLFFTGYGNDAPSSLIVGQNNWHLVGYTYATGATSIVVYLDSQSQTVTLSGGALTTTSTQLLIGAFTPASPSNYWNGIIDDVRIYNYALSAAQVAQLYNYTPSL